MTSAKQRRILARSLLLCLAGPAFAQDAALPSTEAWEYLWVNEIDELGRVVPDATEGCRPITTLNLYGKLGWELIQVIPDARHAVTSTAGSIALNSPTNRGQNGTVQLKSETRESIRILFKRRVPHVVLPTVQCP